MNTKPVIVSFVKPGSPWARHTLAWSLVSQRRFEEAGEAMRAVLEIDPVNIHALPNLAHLLYRRGGYDEAVTTYQKIRERSLASDQIDTDIHDSLCLGLALRGAGLSDEARRVLEGKLAEYQGRIDRGNEPSRQICLLAAVGRSREAMHRAREIESPHPTDPQQLVILTEAYTRMGEPDLAIGALERAFEA